MKKTEHNDHQKKQKDQQSDCQQCKKQRQQNQKLIRIYQKLQKIQNKLTKTKQVLQGHQKLNITNQSNFNTIANQINLISQSSKQQTNNQIIGLQLASTVIERQIRIKRQLQQQKKNVIARQRPSLIITSNQKIQTKPQTSQLDSLTISAAFISRKQSIKRRKMNDQTQSTEYAVSQPSVQQRISYEKSNKVDIKKKSIIGDLSLWLFENEQNLRLENELYNKRENLDKNKNQSLKKDLQNKRVKNSRYQNELPEIKGSNKLRGSNNLMLKQSNNEKRLPIIKK